jgi:hypothetical protein
MVRRWVAPAHSFAVGSRTYLDGSRTTPIKSVNFRMPHPARYQLTGEEARLADAGAMDGPFNKEPPTRSCRARIAADRPGWT